MTMTTQQPDPLAGRRVLPSPPFCVCVPARDEEERLPRLLDALARQDIDGAICVAICLNNVSDGSVAAVAAATSRHAGRLSIDLDVRDFSPELAHAGSGRAAAMALGLNRLGEADGVLITTDADARPPPGWITANLQAIAAGADIVGGRLILDDEEPIPSAIAAGRASWERYWSEVRRIEDELDPLPWDRPPRHGDHTGGSLALTSDVYRRSGGVPLVATGEDRLLVEAALMAGGRLVHPVSVWTRVSARIEGRAAGGMSTALAALADFARNERPLMAPSLRRWRERAEWRRKFREDGGSHPALVRAESRLPPMPSDMPLAAMEVDA